MNNLRNIFKNNPTIALGLGIGLLAGLVLGILMQSVIIGFGSFLSIGLGITILLSSNNR